MLPRRFSSNRGDSPSNFLRFCRKRLEKFYWIQTKIHFGGSSQIKRDRDILIKPEHIYHEFLYSSVRNSIKIQQWCSSIGIFLLLKYRSSSWHFNKQWKCSLVSKDLTSDSQKLFILLDCSTIGDRILFFFIQSESSRKTNQNSETDEHQRKAFKIKNSSCQFSWRLTKLANQMNNTHETRQIHGIDHSKFVTKDLTSHSKYKIYLFVGLKTYFN